MKFKSYFTLLICSLILLPACQDYVDGLQESPNNASDAPIEAIFNAALTGLIIGHEGEDARLAGMWARQFTGSDRQYSSYHVYNMTAEDFQWDKFYLAVENAEIVMQKAMITNNKLALGIAKIIKAHSNGMVAAMWGSVPYSQANQFPELTDPIFDEQKQVYASLQSLLDEAINDLKDDPANAIIAATDFYFGGDPAAWMAVAYTLKARFYLHNKEYANALAATAKGVQEADGNWMIPHTSGSYNQDMNIYHSFGIFDREGYMTANNAVLPTMLDPTTDDYRGNAKTDEAARFAHIYAGDFPNYDLNYAGMWAPTASFPLVTAKENHLIRAEAALRAGSDMPVALEALNAVRAILATQYPEGNYEAYEMADFEIGGIANRDEKTAAESMRYEVLEEKYVSLVGQMEVFNDLRRTDNELGLSPTTGSSFPERYLIPQVEIDANENAPSPIPDLFTPTPVNQ